MSDSDSPTPLDPPAFMKSVRRNYRALLLGALWTLSLLAVAALILGISEPDSAMKLMMAQLVIMAAFMPAAAYGAGRPLDVVYRSGVTTDCFGAFMLAAGLFTRAWGPLDAVKLYVLLTGFGLMLMGACVALRRFRDQAWVGTLGMFVVAGIVVGFHGLVLANGMALGDGPVLKLNLLAAGRDAVGLDQGATAWVTTAMIYGAAAGLFWMVPLLGSPMGPDADPDDEIID
jgi:hypothetical protein